MDVYDTDFFLLTLSSPLLFEDEPPPHGVLVTHYNQSFIIVVWCKPRLVVSRDAEFKVT